MFPISHLITADRVLDLHPMQDNEAAAFLLGSIAPDGVHYRSGFVSSDKLVSHICPKNGQQWGRVTDNELWLDCVRRFLNENGRTSFNLGYATHILSDIRNNIKIWQPLCRDFPDVADQGYGSRYHDEWGNCDDKLYQSLPKTSRILTLLPKAEARGQIYEGVELVSALEVNGIRDNILYESYPAKLPANTEGHVYFKYEALLDLIEDATRFSREFLELI